MLPPVGHPSALPVVGEDDLLHERVADDVRLVEIHEADARNARHDLPRLDEAQNTTSEQMKMFLTRLGFGSKAVITGDITQIDLPTGRVSGLIEALNVVRQIEGIAFIHFDERDVVRHSLVQKIVKAYENFSNQPD